MLLDFGTRYRFAGRGVERGDMVSTIHVRRQPSDLQARGPILPVRITGTGRSGARSGQFVGLIDTGAAFSAIGPLVVAKLGLLPVETETEHGRFHIENPLFAITLGLSKRAAFDLELKSRADLEHPYGVIIGRDILKHCYFSVNFQQGDWVLTFLDPA